MAMSKERPDDEFGEGSREDSPEDSRGKSGKRRREAAGRTRARSHARAGDGILTSSPPSGSAFRVLDQPPWTEGNRILASLPDGELTAVRRHLTLVRAESGQVLYKQGAIIDSVYFPDTAVMSVLNRMASGAVVEVGTIGNEGLGGIAVFLDGLISHSEMICQIPGDVQTIDVTAFRSAVERLPRFRALIAACTNAFMTQVAQTAACNRLHGIEQRCARWLLLTHDRVGQSDSFPLTHQFLSYMLGVRRPGVSEALGWLNRAGFVKSTQGSITILDRRGLESACCECYGIVRVRSAEPFA